MKKALSVLIFLTVLLSSVSLLAQEKVVVVPLFKSQPADDIAIWQGYCSTYSGSITNTTFCLDTSTINQPNGKFSVNSDNIVINESGLYQLYFRVASTNENFNYLYIYVNNQVIQRSATSATAMFRSNSINHVLYASGGEVIHFKAQYATPNNAQVDSEVRVMKIN